MTLGAKENKICSNNYRMGLAGLKLTELPNAGIKGMHDQGFSVISAFLGVPTLKMLSLVRGWRQTLFLSLVSPFSPHPYGLTDTNCPGLTHLPLTVLLCHKSLPHCKQANPIPAPLQIQFSLCLLPPTFPKWVLRPQVSSKLVSKKRTPKSEWKTPAHQHHPVLRTNMAG